MKQTDQNKCFIVILSIQLHTVKQKKNNLYFCTSYCRKFGETVFCVFVTAVHMPNGVQMNVRNESTNI